MRYLKLVLPSIMLAAVTLLFGLSSEGAAGQPGPGVISGRVLPAREGGTLPGSLKVELLTLDIDQETVLSTVQVSPGPDGDFSFRPTSGGPSIVYRLQISAEGFFAEPVDMPATAVLDDIGLRVYPVTRSLADFSVPAFALFVPGVDARARKMAVLGVVTIANTGNTVIQPDTDNPGITGLDLVRFSLPDGYADLSVESDLPEGNVLEIGTGFAITNPIPPGEYSVLMSYTVSYEGDELEFPARFPFGAEVVRVLLPAGQGTLSSEGFGPASIVTVQDKNYVALEGRSILPGTTTNIKFSDLPTPTVLQSVVDFFDGRLYFAIVLWVAAAALLVLLSFALLIGRRRAARSSEAANPGPTARLGERTGDDLEESVARQRLISEIADLDVSFERGEIPEEQYRSRREALKQQVVETGISGHR